MYEDHFGLDARPFQLTPDPRFWFETATHRKAMAYLGYGLAQGEGFIVVTGDIGAGKTTLVGHVMERIDANRLAPVRIVSTQIEADDLLRIVADGLGLEPAGRSKAELLVLIERALHAVARTGRRTLLVVDEAQALPVSALEELRMLSNFQSGGHALLQIFLLGQPEFRDRLQGSDRLEQLRQRVIATHHLDPMEPHEVEAYVAHRLSVAGWKGRPDFADDTFPALYAASAGVPRRLNQIAGRVLLYAAVEGLELIDAAVVDQVMADEGPEPRAQNGLAPAVPARMPARTAELTLAAASGPVAEPVSAMAPVAIAEPEPAIVLAPIVEAAPVAEPVPAPTVEIAPVERPAVPPPRPYLVPDTAMAAHGDHRPMTSPSAGAAPRPIRLATPPAPPPAPPSPVATPMPDPVPAQPAADERLAMLESRLEAQDAALRRVLTLLVDWVEGEGRAPGEAAIASLHGAAA